jgi:bifunctional non-homologous end joining protein LigD
VRAKDAVIDGEICCLEADGRSNFKKLLFRRDWLHIHVFDLLPVNGRDLRALPLIERKRKLVAVLPKIE